MNLHAIILSIISIFQFKINLNLHSFAKRTVVFDLCSKEKVAQLSESEENNEEHDTESGDILCALL